MGLLSSRDEMDREERSGSFFCMQSLRYLDSRNEVTHVGLVQRVGNPRHQT